MADSTSVEKKDPDERDRILLYLRVDSGLNPTDCSGAVSTAAVSLLTVCIHDDTSSIPKGCFFWVSMASVSLSALSPNGL